MSHSLVPVGSVIERIYYNVPSVSSFKSFRTFIDAVRAALIKRDEMVEAITNSYPTGWPQRRRIARAAAKTQCVVDLHWVIFHSDRTGSSDLVIERTNVDHLTIEHCDRMDTFSPQGST